ncbi:MAG: putative efflux rane fusion protein [Labilithrix sp.]|nr:putative efflux rane fusion protein [Labilithrix sp.]
MNIGSRSVLGASLLALVGILGGCSEGHAAQEEGAVPVKATTLSLGTVDEYSDYIATIRSRRSVEIRPQVEGYVARISAKPGDTVSDGALLVQIDPKRQQATTNSAVAASGIAAAEVDRGRATLAQLEAARAGRAAALKLAEEDHRRAIELRKSGAIAQQAEDQATATLEGARAELTAADRQIAAAHAGVSSAEKSLLQTQAAAQAQTVELQYYRIAAPFTGTVGDIPVKIGDLVTPATLLTTLDDPQNTLEAWISVPVEDAGRLHAGLEARLLDASSTVVDHGKVTFVSPRIDANTQSVLVKVELEDNKHDLRAQQFLRARIVWATEPGIRVPVTSLTRMNGQSFAYVVKDGPPTTAAQVPVKVGEVQGNDVIVKDGLKAGDRLVSAGIQKLRNGARVAVEKL